MLRCDILRVVKLFRNKTLTEYCESFPEPWGGILDFVKDVVVIFAVVLLIIRPIFFAPFQVKQQSMMPNILDGEYILVWKLPYHTWSYANYQRNDVVVFLPRTDSDKYLIKRVIGLPGETIRFFDGFVWVKPVGEEEFKKLDESFLSAENLGNTCVSISFCSVNEKSEKVDIVIPEDSYFVMGDNRLHSRDARSCFLAGCSKDDTAHFLSKADIEGKVFSVFARIWDENDKKSFSLTTARWITHPDIQE
ncbi:MAG: signal peptidase I [Candidatus Gracilibacteria bacterium]|nr:signal peptidase I [Candidatus Gracilibacteria bacterium]